MHYQSGRYFEIDTSICMHCEHLTEIGSQNNIGWKCKAFPSGIDQDIAAGIMDHTRPIEGDQGYRFKSKIYSDEEGFYKILWSGDIEEVKE